MDDNCDTDGDETNIVAVIEHLTDDEDFASLVREIIQSERQLRPRFEFFHDWSDAEFHIRFRLSKQGAEYILSLITDKLPIRNDRRGNPVSAEGMLLSTLTFYASGAFMSVCGNRHRLSKATISRYVHLVSGAIASLARLFIHMPRDEVELVSKCEQFYSIARFPKCIGAIDCTHVRLQSPGGEEAEIYRNRKGYFSMNIQTVAGPDLKFQDIVARWHGSAHDSLIFLNSSLRRRFENGTFGTSVIVGDQGYGLKSYLITPIANPSNETERLFNIAQTRTRNVVERSYGVWKRRFPILSSGLRVALPKVEAIVVATAVLHNLAIALNEDLPPTDEAIELQIMNSLVPAELATESVRRSQDSREPFLSYFNSINRP